VGEEPWAKSSRGLAGPYSDPYSTFSTQALRGSVPAVVLAIPVLIAVIAFVVLIVRAIVNRND
jgi:hypothetical protein